MKKTESFTKNILQNNKPTIIYGASLYGEIASYILEKWGGVNPDYIIDATYQSAPFSDVEVLKPESLKALKGRNILICGANGFEGMVTYLNSIGYDNFYDICEMLNEFETNYQENEFQSSYLYGELNVSEIIARYHYYAGIENGYNTKTYLSYCVLPITNKCSLRCKKCAAFIPEYIEHNDYTLDYVKNIMGLFLQTIDGIQELEIMGGEPFMCLEFLPILEWCIAQKKINAIKIVTNATIIPSNDIVQLLKNSKVKLVLDDYKEHSPQLDMLVEIARKNQIRYYIQKLNTWYDVNSIDNQGQSIEELKNHFAGCIMRNCVGITNGRLYHCNVAGHMHNLKKIPDLPEDYIDLYNNKFSLIELRDKIKKFVKKDYLEACNYCTLWHKREILVAEQECN